MSADMNGHRAPDWTPEAGYAAAEWGGLTPPADFGSWYQQDRPQHPRHAYPEPDWAHDTMAGFPPDREYAGEPAPLIPPCRCDLFEWAFEAGRGYDGPCKCEACRYGHQPGSGIVLYDQPGAASMLWAMSVLDGRYEDIEGEFDAVWRRTRKGFAAAERHARHTLDIARHRVEAVAAAELGRAA